MTLLREVLPQRGFDLARHGDAPAIVHDGGTLSHAELDRLVRDRAGLLGTTRRLVLLEGANTLESLVTYLAALSAGHPVLLVPGPASAGAGAERLIETYDPDVLCTSAGSWALTEVRAGTRHDLHPELALLLGTSGSTGSPKMVRLSRDNVLSNAAAIAGYLQLGPHSRAATTLPMHYCYGLSVVNSHLLAGGSLWLTDRSVVDDGFWDAFADAGATTIAGVPYTFELLERSGVDWTAQPGLRQVTQAGGRLAPERVRELALRGRRHGFDFVVMYGQTEATARMAYLPPHLAAERPHAIGVPIDGGEFRLDPTGGSGRGDGELVYSGPNVMLGYAESAADLASGRTVTELHTGDLAVQHDDGLFELVGRRSRLAKLYGTRLDLDLAERLLGERGIAARMITDDKVLRVFVLDATRVDDAVEAVTGTHCIPPHAVRVQVVEDFPTTASGKPDHAALSRLDDSAAAEEHAVDVRSAYEVVFRRRVRDTDTFVALGGDSLSYVEMVVRLEQVLGTLPADWPQRSVAELSARQPRRLRRFASIETPLLLRAVAIMLIVGSHVELFDLMGGAHVLLALFGFNLARFALTAPSAGARLRAVGRSLRELVIPAVLWIGGVALVSDRYDASTVLLLNNVLGEDGWSDQWQFWFLESALWSTVGLAALVSLPGVGRLLGRHQFALAIVVLGATVIWRGLAADGTTALHYYSIERSAWCIALGWVIHAAGTTPQRWLATALVPLTLHGFFPDDHPREWLIIGGVMLLVWVTRVRVPRPLDRVLGWVGGASLFIYLTHWVVYPPLERDHSFLAWLASLVVGVVVWRAYAVARRRIGVGLERARARQPSRTGSSSTP